MVLMIGGIITIIFGLLTIFWWGSYLLEIFKAIIPLVLIVAGLIATYLGYEEYKEYKKHAPKKGFVPEDYDFSAEATIHYQQTTDTTKQQTEDINMDINKEGNYEPKNEN